jgi:transcriptional regulator with XRE-family HTH domain
MASSESPAVARRRVRLAVRQARDAANLTQAQVAEAMEWSHSKVMRIESGEVTIAPNDLRPLLAHLGVKDRSVVDDLVRAAKVSRRRQTWWTDPRFRDHLTLPMRQVIQYEAESTTMRHFSATVIPGPLQTREYAEAILRNYRSELLDEDIEIRVESRMRRRKDLLDRRNPPHILLLLDESVVYRRVGGAKIMGAQLADLANLVRDGRVNVRVLTFATDAPIHMFGSFDIFNLTDDDEDAVLYRESHLYDELVEDRPSVDRHRAMFDQLWEAALDEATSAEMIDGSVKAIQQDAPNPSPIPQPTRSTRQRRPPGSTRTEPG